jgi:hypothetical protein
MKVQDLPPDVSFGILHEAMVECILRWCKDNGIEAFSCHLAIDNMRESIPCAQQLPDTESAFTLFDENKKRIITSKN